MNLRIAACIAFGSLGLVACATSPGPFDRNSLSETIQVEVENQNFYSVTIYAYRGGNRLRLGTVESQNTEDAVSNGPPATCSSS